jgi:hypothetical protein
VGSVGVLPERTLLAARARLLLDVDGACVYETSGGGLPGEPEDRRDPPLTASPPVRCAWPPGLSRGTDRRWSGTSTTSASLNVAGGAPPLSRFTTEQILVWDPFYVIAHDPTDVPVIENNTVLRNLKAVKDRHVTSIPQDLNGWGDFDVAAPLALLWTAEDPYPKQFADINMLSEARYFYSEFVRENLSRRTSTRSCMPLARRICVVRENVQLAR